MQRTGTLRTWHDDRGFGFIAPTAGGRELFVHISAFPRDGSRPVEGESLSYELGRGKDGQPAAVRVFRQALGKPATYPSKRQAPAASGPRRSGFASSVLVLVLIVAVGVYGYTQFRNRAHRQQFADAAPSPIPAEPAAPAAPAIAPERPTQQPASAQFRCDGRTHCSQMTSCSEAKFFLNNCPGTQMDGNHDGIPCEQQWCTSPLAK